MTYCWATLSPGRHRGDRRRPSGRRAGVDDHQPLISAPAQPPGRPRLRADPPRPRGHAAYDRGARRRAQGRADRRRLAADSAEEDIVEALLAATGPIVVARGGSGATTVAATSLIAALGGARSSRPVVGGVHRAGDLRRVGRPHRAWAEVRVTVVSAAVKSILDIPATLERLETLSVTVVGLGTDEFPRLADHVGPAARLVGPRRCGGRRRDGSQRRPGSADGHPGGQPAAARAPARPGRARRGPRAGAVRGRGDDRKAT